MADLVDVPGDHCGSEPSKSETHQPPDTRAAARDQDHLPGDVLLQPGSGQAELHQLHQEVVDGHDQPEGHLHQAGDHLVLNSVRSEIIKLGPALTALIRLLLNSCS